MRIGINASFLRKPGTGIGQVTFNFLEKLKEFSKDGSVEFYIYSEEPLSEPYPANFHDKHFLPFWKRDDLIRKMLWEKQVAREARKDGCDAFISLYQSSTIVAPGMKHIMVVHDIIPKLFPEYQGNLRQKWYWQAVERGIRQAQRIVAVSQATKKDLSLLSISQEKISVAYPDTAPCFHEAITLEEENRVMATYGLVPGYLYHGGGLEIRKNTEALLRAYAQLVEDEKNGTLNTLLPPLVISGKIFPESNPLATPVKTLVRSLGLVERVRLLDFVPEQDLLALYKNALFFIYPSRYEGFGLPVVEALRVGTPVLTSDVSSLPEVVGNAGLLIHPDNQASLITGMKQLLTDAPLRATLREATKAQREHFDWHRFVTTVLAISQKD